MASAVASPVARRLTDSVALVRYLAVGADRDIEVLRGVVLAPGNGGEVEQVERQVGDVSVADRLQRIGVGGAPVAGLCRRRR